MHSCARVGAWAGVPAYMCAPALVRVCLFIAHVRASGCAHACNPRFPDLARKGTAGPNASSRVTLATNCSPTGATLQVQTFGAGEGGEKLMKIL